MKIYKFDLEINILTHYTRHDTRYTTDINYRPSYKHSTYAHIIWQVDNKNNKRQQATTTTTMTITLWENENWPEGNLFKIHTILWQPKIKLNQTKSNHTRINHGVRHCGGRKVTKWHYDVLYSRLCVCLNIVKPTILCWIDVHLFVDVILSLEFRFFFEIFVERLSTCSEDRIFIFYHLFFQLKN